MSESDLNVVYSQSIIDKELESILNGKEGYLLKICNGTATKEDFEQFSKQMELPLDEIKQISETLESSFQIGSEIAEKINTSHPDDIDKELVIKKLDDITTELYNISEQLKSIEQYLIR